MKEEAKEEEVIWGNKQRSTIKGRAQNSTITSKDTAISINDNVETIPQDGALETPSQVKAKKINAQSLNASLTARSKVCFIKFLLVLRYFFCLQNFQMQTNIIQRYPCPCQNTHRFYMAYDIFVSIYVVCGMKMINNLDMGISGCMQGLP